MAEGELRKYLIFISGGRRFALGFEDIKSIVPKGALHSIPEFPYYFAGTCVHEGKAVPVIDARLRFGFEKAEYGDRSCIIICFNKTESSSGVIGLIADSVSVMTEIREEDIQECAPVNPEAYTRYLKGVFMSGNEPCYVVDVGLMINDCDTEKIYK